MAKQSRGTIADTLASARASLKNPSRPFTPADPQRRLHGSLASPSQPRPPPTPFINLNSVFEAERPFTSLHGAPLPPTKPLGSGTRPLSRAGLVSPQKPEGATGAPTERRGSRPGPDILSLDDDLDAGAHRSDYGVSLPRAGGGGGSVSARSTGSSAAEAGEAAHTKGRGAGLPASSSGQSEVWGNIKGLLFGLGGEDTFGMCDAADNINQVLSDPAAVKQVPCTPRPASPVRPRPPDTCLRS